MLAGLNEDLALPLLLQRPAIPQHAEDLAGVTGKVVLVTGAGGSIGSELCIQLASYRPKALIMADHSELALYEIDSTIRQGAPKLLSYPLILGVRCAQSVRSVFRTHQPDMVFHAAALKHVPLMESNHNLREAVKTNLGGTINVANECHHYGATMVLVSTDKAVNPSSIMGMTKRLAEVYVRCRGSTTAMANFAQVRFGNVVGSSGSVIPLFRRQIAQGGPVTVTHPDMTRYLMSIKEAVSLTIQAGAIQHNTPDGYGLFILDMGAPVKITDLAQQLIVHSGQDIKIEYTGLRVGEKLHEELSYSWEEVVPTKLPRVNRGTAYVDNAQSVMDELRVLSSQSYTHRPVPEIKRLLTELVELSIEKQW